MSNRIYAPPRRFLGSSARLFSFDFVAIFRAFNYNTTTSPPSTTIIDHPPPFSTMKETLEELDRELGDSPAEVRDGLTNAVDINHTSSC
jgi:hypothetical protein